MSSCQVCSMSFFRLVDLVNQFSIALTLLLCDDHSFAETVWMLFFITKFGTMIWVTVQFGKPIYTQAIHPYIYIYTNTHKIVLSKNNPTTGCGASLSILIRLESISTGCVPIHGRTEGFRHPLENTPRFHFGQTDRQYHINRAQGIGKSGAKKK